MKKTNLTIIAIIIVAFVISMIAFQTTITEANSKLSPTATPSPRKIRKAPKPKGFQEISGIGMEVTSRRKKPRTKAQYNPKEIGVDKVSRKKNLGDTATHERKGRVRN